MTNNNNTNTEDNVVELCHAHSLQKTDSLDDCITEPNGRRPSDQVNRLAVALSPPVSCYRLHPPSRFTIITHPES